MHRCALIHFAVVSALALSVELHAGTARADDEPAPTTISVPSAADLPPGATVLQVPATQPVILLLPPLQPAAPGPLSPVPLHPLAQRRSNGMVIAGIVLTGIGGAGLGAGAVTLLLGTAACSHGRKKCEQKAAAGGAGMALGSALLGVGITLWSVGVRARKESAYPPPNPAAELTVGLGTTAFKWTF